MFWKARPTIETDDEEWQLEAWKWLLENLGGLEALQEYPTLRPTHSDFPKSGKTGHEHVKHVLQQVAERIGVDHADFELRPQEVSIDAVVAPLAAIENAPSSPLGTYSVQQGRHLITYDPKLVSDLEALIGTIAHELCHPILFAIESPPPGGNDNEEFATDLAMVFFGFGIFGGNGSFSFSQFRDDATGTQGWSTQRSGYLSQNEWGYALAVRSELLREEIEGFLPHCSIGLAASIKKNIKYIRKNDHLLRELRK